MRYENVNAVTLAERLVAARKAANVTQEAGAAHLGISRPTFIAIEKGVRRPKPTELIRLAELYNVALNKLLRQGETPERLRPHLRSIIDATSEGHAELEAAIALLTGFIDDYQYLETLLNAKATAHFPPPVRVGAGPVEQFAEHCAQEERARLNLGAHQPISTLRKTLEEAGMRVFVDKVHSKLAGLYVFVPDFGYCILVNGSHPRQKRRWTIAHEYGHFLIDRDRPGVDYLKPMQRRPENERFADSFAAAFLMPEAGIRRRFYEEIERTGDFRVGDLCRLAEHFDVSLMAMALRLESIGLIPRGSWDRLTESGVSISNLKKEAGIEARDDRRPRRPYPERYRLLAAQAFIQGKITEGQLAKFLRCSRVEARELAADIGTVQEGDGGSRSIPLALDHSLLSETANKQG
jgi:Zn-dependent peptidase ImmA (M78 family)/DNA-binding XRE family transcriptional regulator